MEIATDSNQPIIKIEATESSLTLKVGVLLPNCPEYAVVVLGVSLIYQFFYTTIIRITFLWDDRAVFFCKIFFFKSGASRRSDLDNPEPCLHPSWACSSGSTAPVQKYKIKIKIILKNTKSWSHTDHAEPLMRLHFTKHWLNDKKLTIIKVFDVMDACENAQNSRIKCKHFNIFRSKNISQC